MIKIKSNNIILQNCKTAGCVYIENDKIVEISTVDKSADITYDFTDKIVAPGFIDIHTHGGGGYAFANSSPSEVAQGCNYHLRFGSTSIVPTVSASAFSDMQKSLDNIHRAKVGGLAKNNIIGAHLEGPYLSKNQSGAQCPDFITPPIKDEYENLVKNYGSSITRWTYAPENDNGEFCKYITAHKIIASAGHTDATSDDMSRAIKCGCNLITHLYSCTSTVTRKQGFRSLGVVESAYLFEDLTAEIIADGKHLPRDLIKMIVKIKGADKVIATTDSLSVAGTKSGRGTMCGTDFIVEDGVAKLPDRSAFAGSVATANVLLKTLLDCGFSMPDCVKMLSTNPAKLLKLNKGELKCGYDADIIVLNDDLNIETAFVMGKKVV